jgi:hypothetical protein
MRAPIGNVSRGGALMLGLGNTKLSVATIRWVGAGPGGGERGGGQPADIGIIAELHPGPAGAALIDRRRLALQRLGEEGRIGRGRGAKRHVSRRDRRRLAHDEAFGLDLAAQGGGGEIGPRGGQARVERAHGVSSSTVMATSAARRST